MLIISCIVMIVMMFVFILFVEDMNEKAFFLSFGIFLVSAVTFTLRAFIFLASMPGNGV